MPKGHRVHEVRDEADVELPGRFELRCMICEKSFTILRAHYLRGRRCCSTKCGRIRRSQNALVELRCEWCGAPFQRLRSRLSKRNYCSRDCVKASKAAVKKPRSLKQQRSNDRRWERYQADAAYREHRKRIARETHARHKDRYNEKRRRERRNVADEAT